MYILPRRDGSRFITDYQPLHDFLQANRSDEVSLQFQQLEKVLGQSLPRSARKHQAWWSNTATHSHARFWMNAGWRTRKLDLANETVTFARASSPAKTTATPPEPVQPVSDDSIHIPRSALTPRALRFLRNRAEAADEDVVAALVRIVEECAIKDLEQMFAWFRANSPYSEITSAELIREDRDAR